MKLNKIQKEIFDALMKGERVVKFDYTEDKTFFTVDACVGFVIDNKDIRFKEDKCNHVGYKFVDIDAIIESGNVLQYTCDMKSDGFMSRRILRRLKGNGYSSFVNDKYLDYFSGDLYYQMPNESDAVIVVCNADNEPEGVILPVRGTKLDYYNDYDVGVQEDV